MSDQDVGKFSGGILWDALRPHAFVLLIHEPYSHFYLHLSLKKIAYKCKLATQLLMMCSYSGMH